DCPRRSGIVSAGVVSTFTAAMVSTPGVTVTKAAVVAARACASATETLMVFVPLGIAPPTVMVKEKRPSPGVASPFKPSSKRVCVAEPPSGVRSAVTVMPVLGGAAPGVTSAMIVVAVVTGTVGGMKPATALRPQELGGLALLRGAAAAAVKSALLFCVS